ncbi:MAG: CoA ester lyase [Gammaproteobacteria bacterium]|nr:CoA ester lyase [Gammaproteobacteria bacterium]
MRNPNPIRARRSVHFVPGPNEKMLTKSLESEADTLVIDLEDAVAPDDKATARDVICDWLANVDFGRKEVAIRLNALDTPWGLEDIDAIMTSPPHLFMIPKAERLSELQLLNTLITNHEVRQSIVGTSVGLLLIGSETPRSVENLHTLAGEPRVEALTWGAEDLAAAIGASENRNSHGRYLGLFALCGDRTLLAARSNGVQPIDSVFVRLDDESALREECENSRKIGFTGKLTIHPSQIPIVNDTFTPNPDEVERAQRLIEAFAEARQTGRNAFRFEGQMVDAPHLSQARDLLNRVEQIGET